MRHDMSNVGCIYVMAQCWGAESVLQEGYFAARLGGQKWINQESKEYCSKGSPLHPPIH